MTRKYNNSVISDLKQQFEKYIHEALVNLAKRDLQKKQRRLVKAIESKSIIPYEYEYTYGDNKLTIVCHRYDTGELFGTTIYNYDLYKNLVKKIWINGTTGKESLEIWNEYEYSPNGSIKKMTSHDYLLKTYLTFKESTYNTDRTIHNIHVAYSLKQVRLSIV